jgi:CRISPR-associated protein Cmr3
MDMGETHDTGRPVFPPIPATVVGALRTAILAQQGIDPWKLAQLRDDEDLDPEKLPFWGSPVKSGFRTVGPMLMVGDIVLFPAPANWFYIAGTKHKKDFRFFKAMPVVNTLPVRTARPKLSWIKDPPDDANPMNGAFWVTKGALEQEELKLEIICDLRMLKADSPQAVPVSTLVATEYRIGIARNNKYRAAKDGHLYATRHIRLREGVSLLVGVDKPLCPSHLAKSGVFQFGGEGRLVRYSLLEKHLAFPGKRQTGYLAVSPLLWDLVKRSGLLAGAYVSGKLFRVGGWDMRKEFHKPVETYFPIGAVFFNEKDPEFPELIPF